MELGLSVQVSKSSAAAIVLTLTPYGKKLNDELHHFIDEVLKASMQLILGTDPGVFYVRFFIDKVAFLGTIPKFR